MDLMNGHVKAQTCEAQAGEIPLSVQDPELFGLLKQEKNRQRTGIELIASENFTSRAVMDCLGSALTNKYSEGYPGKRYYGGNEFIDKIEILCQQRALKAFRLDSEVWGVNVQPYSGSPANFEVYTALLKPHDRIMGLDLFHGGHLTHGFYTAKKRISATSIYFESLPYRVDIITGLIDYAELRKSANTFRPNLIVAGTSAYSRNLNYAEFRSIADECGAILMGDMAHVSGLVAAGLVTNPFEYCDVVTTTSHKSLRGPRAGMIFFNKKKIEHVEEKINEAVFPALQGGPHNHQIAALACQLKEVATPEWKEYSTKVLANIRALAKFLMAKDYKLVTSGTDNHLILWDLSKEDLTGSKMQETCDAVGITLNMNGVPGDKSALSPSGIRIGSPAMTSRGLGEKDFEEIGQFLHECVQICKSIQDVHGRKLPDFRKGLIGNEQIMDLTKRVRAWAGRFPMPGREDI